MKRINVIEIANATKKVPESSQSQLIGISILFILFLLSFLFLIFSGFSLTILKGQEYATLAETNSVGKVPIFGERGMIIDRNGKALVENLKTYDVFIDPNSSSEENILALFPDHKEKIHSIFANPAKITTLLIHNVAKDLVISLKDKKPAGIELRHSYVRNYLNPLPFAHLLGYTGIASEDDLSENKSLVANQIVGKTGIEYQYDTKLQGEIRYETYEKDAFGTQLSILSDTPPATGDLLTLTIDKKYQERMYSVIKKTVDVRKARGGSGVLLDVNTGEVLALVSYPTFNPNDFVSGIPYSTYDKLIKSPQTPLLNRPIGSQEPPGSTFKTIVATAALETGAINTSTVFVATGVIKLAGGLPFQDYMKHYYGPLTITDALMVSSNIFFCRTAIRLGIDRLIPYAEAYGIGRKTGIDLPGEMPGRVPSPENKIWLAKNGATWLDPVWYPEGDTCNSAIGQGIALATPIQMATIAAAIANGGTEYQPHVVKTTTTASGKVTSKAPVVVAIGIANDSTLQIIREGMRLSVAGPRGVISSLKYVPIKVAAKTGTAEFGIKDKYGYSTTHAWVIGFYPYNEPKYAFAVLIEGGGSSSVASFAMRDFLNAIY